MATVSELTVAWQGFLLGPRTGDAVCKTCFNFTRGFGRCYSCARHAQWLNAVLPISYSVAGEHLHYALVRYKRTNGAISRRFAVELGALLWRFIERHERCLAGAAGASAFDLVATVPSGAARRDEQHPLRQLVGEVIQPTRRRHERLLLRSALLVEERRFHPHKYECTRPLAGQSVLLIDDTWTTGTNAQSAAAALKLAGSGPVGIVVIGRHINRAWHQNDRRLRELGAFDWEVCAVCAPR